MNKILTGFFVGVSIVVVVCLFWLPMWDGEVLGKWASVVTILSLASIPVTYWVRQSDKEREKQAKKSDETTRISKNLCGELGDVLGALENHPDDVWKIEIDGTTVTFTNRLLNRDVYSSLVFSGRINSIEYELQQKIQDVYTDVENHNRYLKYVEDHYDNAANEKMVAKYCAQMGRIESKLKQDIPPLIDRLRKSGFGRID